MSISRRALYAAGEAFGDAATRREGGRLILGGGGSSSKSSTSAFDNRLVTGQESIGVTGKNRDVSIGITDASQTTNQDNRTFTQNTALTDSRSNVQSWSNADSSVKNTTTNTTTNITASDFKSVASAFDFAKAADATRQKATDSAFDFAESIDATRSENFDRLLNVADGLFDKGASMVDRTRETVESAFIEATNAATEAQGQISQKTIIIVAAIGAAALFAMRKG